MLCVVGTCGAGAEPPRLDIEVEPGLEAVAARLARVSPESLLAVMRLVGSTTAGMPIKVVLAPEHSSLARGTRPWIAGFALGTASTVVLFPSRSPSYPHDSLEDVLLHEVAHVLIARVAGGAEVPRWFGEGLAMAAERAPGFRDRTRVMLAAAIDRPPLGRLDGEFRASEWRMARAYALSGALVRDILRRHGPDAAARILALQADGVPFDESVRQVTGRTVVQIERAFWDDSWWVVPFLTSSVVLWFGVTCLALYARSVRAARRATLRGQWARQEAQEEAEQWRQQQETLEQPKLAESESKGPPGPGMLSE